MSKHTFITCIDSITGAELRYRVRVDPTLDELPEPIVRHRNLHPEPSRPAVGAPYVVAYLGIGKHRVRRVHPLGDAVQRPSWWRKRYPEEEVQLHGGTRWGCKDTVVTHIATWAPEESRPFAGGAVIKGFEHGDSPPMVPVRAPVVVMQAPIAGEMSRVRLQSTDEAVDGEPLYRCSAAALAFLRGAGSGLQVVNETTTGLKVVAGGE